LNSLANVAPPVAALPLGQGPHPSRQLLAEFQDDAHSMAPSPSHSVGSSGFARTAAGRQIERQLKQRHLEQELQRKLREEAANNPKDDGFRGRTPLRVCFLLWALGGSGCLLV
jgi:hypothetical protein